MRRRKVVKARMTNTAEATTVGRLRLWSSIVIEVGGILNNEASGEE